MAFNIKDFSSTFSGLGYLQNNKFEVYLTTPEVLRLGYTGIERILIDRIQSISIPSLELIAIENQRYGVGPPQKYAITSRFNDITINMIVDRRGYIYQFFRVWYNNVVNSLPENNRTYQFPKYVVEYKDNYSSHMQLVTYNNQKIVSNRINFYDVYPLNLSEIPLSWKSQNEMLELNVVLTYKDLTVN